jgi:hypothetical protein
MIDKKFTERFASDCGSITPRSLRSTRRGKQYRTGELCVGQRGRLIQVVMEF